MPRATPRLISHASLLAAALAAASGLAVAQQQSTAPQSTQNQPPANVQSVEPGSDTPASNIPTRRGTEIVERRENGQVTSADVTAGGSHYTIQPNNPAGNAAPGSVTGNQVRAPQWSIKTFDLTGKRRAATDSGNNVPISDAPPPLQTTAPEKK